MNIQERELFDERMGITLESDVDWREAIRIAYAQVESHRHACEVRAIVAGFKQHGREWIEKHLVDIARHRGDAAAKNLRLAAREIFIAQRGTN